MALNRARGGEDSLRSCVHAAGFGERFVRLIKANVNEALNKAEDPEKMLNQIVEDMQVRNRPTCPRRCMLLLYRRLCAAPPPTEAIHMQPIDGTEGSRDMLPHVCARSTCAFMGLGLRVKAQRVKG
jgi:hypothetical protein